MRFIHTADWHLGRSFYNISLIDDQAHVLNQLIDFAREAKPDLLIIAGDIYDRAVPPTEAVKLLDEVLCRLILDLKVPVFVIAGNHDSPLRLEFAARLMESHRLYVLARFKRIQRSTCSMIGVGSASILCRMPSHLKWAIFARRTCRQSRRCAATMDCYRER
jgi:exonuclease SbcD